MSITLIVRTIVPAFWASFIAWLLGFVPALEPLREVLLAQSEIIVGLISALLLGAWVALSNWLAPKLPDWAARILMGSTKTPTYDVIATYDYADIDQTAHEQRQPIPGTTLEGLGE